MIRYSIWFLREEICKVLACTKEIWGHLDASKGKMEQNKGGCPILAYHRKLYRYLEPSKKDGSWGYGRKLDACKGIHYNVKACADQFFYFARLASGRVTDLCIFFSLELL